MIARVKEVWDLPLVEPAVPESARPPPGTAETRKAKNPEELEKLLRDLNLKARLQ